MPELPEVETTKTSLLPLLGQKVRQVTVYQPRLRWLIPDDIQHIIGKKLTQLQRRAKYIIATFDDCNRTRLLCHLGMSGSFRICPPDEALRKHDHLVIDFGQQQLRYHDPRRFGCIVWLNDEFQQKLLQPLGVEPLSDDFTADYLWQKLQHKKTPIKVALMDNHIVVGVGNIYATECLFNTHIHPAQPANSLSIQQIQQLVIEIKTILTKAIELGGSTLKDFQNAMGENGYFQQTLLAYGRVNQPCVRCQTPLQNIKLAQRASVFCPQCQALF